MYCSFKNLLSASKDIAQRTNKKLFNDIPLIVFVILLQSLSAALFPESGVSFHFGKGIFICALLKAFWIGIASSLLSFNKKFLKWLFIIINVIVLDIYLYLSVQFSVRITPNVMNLVLQTNPNETREFFLSYFPLKTISILTIATFVILCLYYFATKYWSLVTQRVGNKTGSIIIFLAIIGLFGISFYSNSLVNAGFANISKRGRTVIYDTTLPYNDIFLSLYAIGSNSEKVEKIYEANKGIKIDSCLVSSPNIVLVLGESFIKSHSSLYGYRHETSPLLQKEKLKGNLFVFNNVVSHSCGTNICMQYFYSTKSLDDNKIWEESPLFPAVFKKAKYNVTLLDNQSTRYKGTATLDYSTSFFINPISIHNQCFDYRNNKVYKYDDELIQAERKHLNNKSNRTLAIIHLYGQHFGASERYPHTSDHMYFTADSINRKDLSNEKDKLQDIAHYDNATRYNDYVINDIINLYRNKDAVIVYVADHGECVYDDSALTLGRTISECKTEEAIKLLYEVPMVIWCSDKYLKNHSDIVERIRKSVDRPFMHDDICHVLFDLAGIYSSHFSPQRSVINDKFKARPRLINGGKYNYDANKTKIDKIKLRNMHQ